MPKDQCLQMLFVLTLALPLSGHCPPHWEAGLGGEEADGALSSSRQLEAALDRTCVLRHEVSKTLCDLKQNTYVEVYTGYVV